MSGRRSRDKGNRAERHLVHLLQGAGLAAERVHSVAPHVALRG